MKNLFSTIFWSVFLAHSFGQSTAQGIYLSVDDFDSSKISFVPVEGKKYKMILHETFYTPIIKIVIGDSTYTFSKDSVFGYRDKENVVHRYYRGHTYSLLNPGEGILLYSRTFLGGYKSSQTIVAYYFSVGASTPPQRLTKWNLKKVFPADASFHELLDLYFRNDADLLGYDSFYKMYKLNRVLQFSQQALSKKILQ